jgi:amino acid adenylation domain-containing protein/non-ribosomal peptide synthase protein (TIGR01720 family)
VSNLSQRLTDLPAEKQALLIRRLRQKRVQESIVPIPVQPRDNRRLFPLSPTQKRFWIIYQLNPSSPAYNVPIAMQLHNSLDVDILKCCFDEILRRHEALRTVFCIVDEQPFQRILPQQSIPLPVRDLRKLPDDIRQQSIDQIIHNETSTPFDLEKGPLLRAVLLRLPDEYILVMNLHHIIMDQRSLRVLINELKPLYQAFSNHQPSPLPPLPIQYVDYVMWQQGQSWGKDLDYWRQQLGDDLPALDLPTDRPRPPVQQTSHGATYKTVIPSALTEQIKSLSRTQGATLFMTLLAAFIVLLRRYTRQDDISIGTPIANRNRPELQQVIGSFINTLVLRSQLSGDPPFEVFLQHIRQIALDAYRHAEVPFENLVETLQPARNVSQSPFFQVMFELLTALKQPLNEQSEGAGVIKDVIEIETETARFDLRLMMEDRDGRLNLSIIYNTDLFDAETIRRITAQYEVLLQGIVADPKQRLSSLPLLTEQEKKLLLMEWTNTTRDLPTHVSVTQLIESYAASSPALEAVSMDGESLSYGELNRRANQLARYLQELGVRPEQLVGICVEPSMEMVVGMLAVLKAGGAYVPLDPAYPENRLAFMLSDSQLSVLLTQEVLAGGLPEHEAIVVHLDSDWEMIARLNGENLPLPATADHPAYVIYTSGSTGQPKGVVVSHRNLVHSTKAREYYYEQALTSFLLLSSYAFDSSVVGIYWTLCQGGTLHIPSSRLQKDLLGLIGIIEYEQISHLLAIPSFYAAIIEQAAPPQLKSLRTVIVAGEACPKQLVEQHTYLLGTVPLVNEYGPTEGTVWCTAYDCQDQGERIRVPIGRPIANTQIYLLDERLNPVPIGVPGELYIGGQGVARGYWQRPELTAEQFIPHPFSPSPGARLYRTGDLARYLPDGNIEFLGRIDHQVKIRGYRIELGEIEAVLNQHPHIHESVVLAREVQDQKQLVAYVTPSLTALEASSEVEETEHVIQWKHLYDDTYTLPATNDDAKFNIVGWNSSYTGEPIPDDEMLAWTNHTVERILALRPKRVLEIGCGTGLLLFRIAPQCKSYWGTDFAKGALEHVQKELQKPGQKILNVELFHKQAEDYTGFDEEIFDTIILNSVVQYFPGIEYLVQVLQGAMQRIPDGGTIFIGDVRHQQLLETFHASVQLHRAPNSMPLSTLYLQTRKAMRRDKELSISPTFFLALKQRFPGISHVEIMPKRGHYQNELSKFRYDVVLHINEHEHPAVDVPWLDWCSDELTLETLRQQLRAQAPEILGIRRVPNARLMRDVSISSWLRADEQPEMVGQLKQWLETADLQGVEPETLWNLADELPYKVDISWVGAEADGSFDVVLKHQAAGIRGHWQHPDAEVAHHFESWTTYASNPLQGDVSISTRDLRQFLEAALPNHMVPPNFLVLDELPLMPNGKVNRRALPIPETERDMERTDYVAPRNEKEMLLAEIWAQILGREKVSIHDNFFELGGDSILSIRVLARANQAGLRLSTMDLFNHQTIAELTTVIDSTPMIKAEQGLLSGAAILTPIQQWFFEQNFSDAHHWNQAVLLEVKRPFKANFLYKALYHIMQQHDALRFCYRQSLVGWQQFYAEMPENLPFSFIDLSLVPKAQKEAVLAEALAQAQAAFDLAKGPLIRLVLIDLGANSPGRLLLTLHHLVVDFVSMQILLTDLQTIYQQLSYHKPISLPPKTISFKYWGEQLVQHVQSGALDEELDYWLESSRRNVLPIPVDFPNSVAENTQANVQEVVTWLSEKKTESLLRDTPKVYHTQISDLLLTAVVQVFTDWTQNSAILLDMEGHGREEIIPNIDLSRTVGWFTTLYPVLFHLDTKQPGEAIKAIKEQLRQIPHRGIGYGLLQYFGGTGDLLTVQQQLQAQPQAQVSFNYLGQFSQFTTPTAMFRPVQDSSGPWYSPRSHRTYLIDIHGIIIKNQLRMTWLYNNHIHRKTTIEKLAGDQINALSKLIDHCLTPDAGGYTPSDFPLTDLSQAQLDKLLAKKKKR